MIALRKNYIIKPFAVIFLFTGVICLLLSLILFFNSNNYFKLGQEFNLDIANKLGGFVAGVTGVFFSATGVFLVYLTFEQQRDQFELNHFENSFFNLMNYLHSVVVNLEGNVDSSYENPYRTGRDYILESYKDLQHFISKSIKKYLRENQSGDLFDTLTAASNLTSDQDLPAAFNEHTFEEFLKNTYSEFTCSYDFKMSHYFHLLTNILQHIDTSNLHQKLKTKYANLMKSQLTDSELGHLLYYGLSEDGKGLLYPLLTKYNVFTYFDVRRVKYWQASVRLYPNTVFRDFRK